MNDRKDDPGAVAEDDIELEDDLDAEDSPEPEDETDPEAGDAEAATEDEPAGDQGDETPADAGDEEDDEALPDDPIELRRIARDRTRALRKQTAVAEALEKVVANRAPQTREDREEPKVDKQLVEDMAAIAADPDSPASRMILRLTERILASESTSTRQRENDTAMRKVPPKHQAHVQTLVNRFGMPVPVAHQIYKGLLYDKAIERARARKGGGEPAKPESEGTPIPKGSAKNTVLKPVKKLPVNSGGASLDLGNGLKVMSKYTPDGYAALLDGCKTIEEKQAIYRARKDDRIAVEAKL